MLQIGIGKLFGHDDVVENKLRGILYSNLYLGYEEGFDTLAGNISSISDLTLDPLPLVYDFTEKVERPAKTPGSFISAGIYSYQHDYAILLSFCFNCVVTPDVNLAKRLMGDNKGMVTGVKAQDLVGRFFDDRLYCNKAEIQSCKELVNKIIRLPRVVFLKVMLAIKTYINALHRIHDSIELSYSLLVASVEALATEFDSYECDWNSYDVRKRKAIDEALEGASEATSNNVRSAILDFEHVSLAKRFKEFTKDNISEQYFRREKSNDCVLLSKSDVDDVLNFAYQARSKYIHELKKLPDLLYFIPGLNEVVILERCPRLTIHGLSCLMREVIINFIMKQESIEKEIYDYSREHSSVIYSPMAPQYWVSIVDANLHECGKRKFEGYLQLLSNCLLKNKNAKIISLKSLFVSVFRRIENMNKVQSLPYLALCVVYNMHLPDDHKERIEIPDKIKLLIDSELTKPSSESIFTYVFDQDKPEWEIKVHHEFLNKYFKERTHRKGIRVVKLFESAAILCLMERYRLTGDEDKFICLLKFAVENDPGNEKLLSMEKSIDMQCMVVWQEMLL